MQDASYARHLQREEIALHHRSNGHPNVLEMTGVVEGALPLSYPDSLAQGPDSLGLTLKLANGGSVHDKWCQGW